MDLTGCAGAADRAFHSARYRVALDRAAMPHWSGLRRSRSEDLYRNQWRSREIAMKFLLLTIGLVARGVALSSSAQSQNYPWCAVLNMGDAAYNCGFLTMQQCM